jgi:hypothetical protein
MNRSGQFDFSLVNPSDKDCASRFALMVKIWRCNWVEQHDKRWLITMVVLIARDFSPKIAFGMKVFPDETKLFHSGLIALQKSPKKGKQKPELPKPFLAYRVTYTRRAVEHFP